MSRTEYGLGSTKPAKYASKLESEYATLLELLKKAGEILWYEYEAVKLRLGDGAYYTPDFLVMLPDKTLECHEVKGHWREAARVRIKVAAGSKPFRFKAITKVKGQWQEELF